MYTAAMSLDALIMLAGFFVAILPFLGFPIQWDNVLLVIVGIFIIALGVFVRRRYSNRRVVGTTFVESAPRTDLHEAN